MPFPLPFAGGESAGGRSVAGGDSCRWVSLVRLFFAGGLILAKRKVAQRQEEGTRSL